MPKRPPKQWWNKCIKGVKKSSKAIDPESICGSLWHHKLSESQKRKIVKEEESKKRK